MTKTGLNHPDLQHQRRWDELRSFGAVLADNPYRLTADRIARVAQRFELRKTPAEEAVHVLLQGLTIAVETINEEKADDE